MGQDKTTQITEDYIMVESVFTYNFATGVDEKQHWEFLKQMLTILLRDKKIVDFRSQKNLMGSPSTKLSIFWKHATHWAAFIEMEEWQNLHKKLSPYTRDLKIELWSSQEIDSVIIRDTE